MHFDLLLLVGSRNIKVIVRDPHLFKCVLWLSRRHMALLHEMIKWSYQVLAEVKIVVIHLCWQDQTARPSAVVVQIFGVLKWNQLVFHPVDDESWRSYSLYFLNVVEPVLNQVFQVSAGLVLGDVSNRFKA